MTEQGGIAVLLITLLSCFGLAWGCDLQQNHSGADSSKSGRPMRSRDSVPQDPQSAAQVIRNPLGMSMVFIRHGQFQMGNHSPERFGNYSRCEGPKHAVRLSRDFRISQHEVTVGEFRTFVETANYITDAERMATGCNGLDLATGQVIRHPKCLWASPGFPQTDQHPVVCVSWDDASQFCQWLSTTTGQHYRLPTEAEWEYCCRAGTETDFSTGEEPESLMIAGNAGDQSLRMQCPSLTSPAAWDDGFPFTAPGGSFLPNPFGLYDMHGNVGEWCLDWFAPDSYSVSPTVDPTGPETSREWRVVRGGSWYNHPISCRSSGRHDGVPTEASTTNGFRVVMEIP